METRYNGNVLPFASNSTAGERTIFGDWNTESDDINDNLNADFLTGWEAGLEGVTNPYPPSQYFNAALYTATKLVAYLYQNGIAEWNATQEYKTNSISVGSNGSIYRSTIDNNIGNNPTTDAVNWVNAFDSSNFVKLTTNQSIAGIKTFASFPITPSAAPTSNYQVANKKYVDDNKGLQDTAHSFTTSGYQIFSNGFIIQWSNITADGTYSWPISFPNNCLSASATLKGVSGTATNTHNGITASKTTFTATTGVDGTNSQFILGVGF